MRVAYRLPKCAHYQLIKKQWNQQYDYLHLLEIQLIIIDANDYDEKTC